MKHGQSRDNNILYTEFSSILYGSDVGRLRFSAKGAVWKGSSKNAITLFRENISWATWHADEWLLKYSLVVVLGGRGSNSSDVQRELTCQEEKDRETGAVEVVFEGFLRDDYEELFKVFREYYGLTLWKVNQVSTLLYGDVGHEIYPKPEYSGKPNEENRKTVIDSTGNCCHSRSSNHRYELEQDTVVEGGAVINDDDVQLDREKTQISNEYSRAGASYTMYSTSTGSKEPVIKLEPEDDEILEVKPSFLSQPSAHRTTHGSAWGETAPGDVVYVIEGSDETPSTLSSGPHTSVRCATPTQMLTDEPHTTVVVDQLGDDHAQLAQMRSESSPLSTLSEPSTYVDPWSVSSPLSERPTISSSVNEQREPLTVQPSVEQPEPEPIHPSPPTQLRRSTRLRQKKERSSTLVNRSK